MPDMSSSRTAVLERVLWSIALAAAAVALVVFACGVAQRVGYPHELEWMEGALADHAWRVANGLPIYCAPSPEHVPFLYAPLLFWLGGLGIWLGFDPIVALRLVSIAATVGTAMLVGHWVRRETARVAPGLVASGLFFAGYGWLAWWYDLARNDTLFVLLCVATSYQLRHGGARRWVWAALLATAALLAKQSALMWLPAVGVGALCVDWRTALRFGAATALAMGVAVGLLHLGTDGWSTFYLFDMPRHHGWNGDRKLGFWTEDVVPMLPLLVLGIGGFVAMCRAGAVRPALFLAAFGSGALATSWLSRLHVGGFDNVLLYGFAGACVLGPIAAAKVTADAGGVVRVAAVVLLLAQFVWLGAKAWQRGTATWLPSTAHRQAHDELAAFVARQPGPVWVPAHGAITTRAGKATGAHGQAIFDLLQALPKLPDGMFDLEALIDHSRLDHLPARMQLAITSLIDATAAALRQKRLAAIVVDEVGGHAFAVVFAAGLAGPDGQPGTGDDPYVRMPGQLLANPKALAPLLGFEVHSPYALVPRR
jgi:hypothetical protein